MTDRPESAGMVRARKVEASGRQFIVIAEDAPYFREAYGLVRIDEMAKGTWAAEDEAAFKALTDQGADS